MVTSLNEDGVGLRVGTRIWRKLRTQTLAMHVRTVCSAMRLFTCLAQPPLAAHPLYIRPVIGGVPSGEMASQLISTHLFRATSSPKSHIYAGSRVEDWGVLWSWGQPYLTHGAMHRNAYNRCLQCRVRTLHAASSITCTLHPAIQLQQARRPQSSRPPDSSSSSRSTLV